MLSGLVLTAFLMGLGGMPHCAAMCGAPCAAAFPNGVPVSSLLGRCVGYGLLGAIAALGAGTVAGLGRQVAFLQPLWSLILSAAVLTGVYLAWSGRMPHRINQWGLDLYHRVRLRWQTAAPGGKASAARRAFPFLAGMAWVVMPCGLLYAALMVAALAPSAWGGALVMLAFAVPGAVGVWAAPVVLREVRRLLSRPVPAGSMAPAGANALCEPLQAVPVTWLGRGGGGASSIRGGEGPKGPGLAPAWVGGADRFDPRWAVRVSGTMLAGIAGWALYHQLLAQWQAWCA